MVEEMDRRQGEMEPFERAPRAAHLPHAVGYRQTPTEEMAGYTYLTGETAISRDALVLYGISVEDDGAAAVVTLREGRGALAPIIMVINALATQGAWREWPRGIEIDNGLFVVPDGNTNSVTVLWRPRYEREA